jgi:hypothetical protein
MEYKSMDLLITAQINFEMRRSDWLPWGTAKANKPAEIAETCESGGCHAAVAKAIKVCFGALRIVLLFLS